MKGQINIYELLQDLPPVGSVIYFVTSGKIIKATIVSHDASFVGLPYVGYIRVQEKDGQMWSVNNFYSSLIEAKESLN